MKASNEVGHSYSQRKFKNKENCSSNYLAMSNKLTQKIVTPKSSHNSLYESLNNSERPS